MPHERNEPYSSPTPRYDLRSCHQPRGRTNGTDHEARLCQSIGRARRSARACGRHGASSGTGARHRELESREGHRVRQGRRRRSLARRLSSARGSHVETHGRDPPVRRRISRRQQGRRLHHQRCQSARRSRLHEYLRELSPHEPRLVARADSRHEGRDPLDPRERQSARRGRRQDCRSRLLGRRPARAHGRRHERQTRARGRGRHARCELRGQCLYRRLSAG